MPSWFVRFPNTLEEVAALESIEECWFARHLLACFYYNKRSYGKAIALWQRCVEMSPEFADGWRGLAIHAWNKQHDYELAARYLDNAYQLAPQDARLLFERDLLDKLSGVTPEKRLARLEDNLEIALKRDDMTAELLNLWHLTGQADKAADILATRKFHPWEGGEGRSPASLSSTSYYAPGSILMTESRSRPANCFMPRCIIRRI